MRTSQRRAVLLCAAVILSGSAAPGQQYLQGQWRLGLEAGFNAVGDEFTHTITDYSFRPAGFASGEYFPFHSIGINLAGYGGVFANSDTNLKETRSDKYLPFDEASYHSSYVGGVLGASYYLPSLWRFTPTVYVRGGVLYHKTTADLGTNHVVVGWKPVLTYGFGGAFETAITDRLSVRASYSAYLTSSDELDAFVSGERRDGISTFTFGVLWTFNPVERVLDRGWFTVGSSPETGEIPVPAGGADIPRDGDKPPSSGTPAEGGSLGLALELDVDDFASIDELSRKAERLRMSVSHVAKVPVRLTTSFDMRHDGQSAVKGTTSLLVPPLSGTFNATDLLSTDSLQIGEGYRSHLPTGKYDFDVSARSQDGSTAQTTTTFDHLDYATLFPSQADKVRTMVEAGEVKWRFFRDREILISVFPVTEDASSAGAAVGGRTGEEAGAGDRGAVMVIPASVAPEQRSAYIATAVRNAFTKAHVIRDAVSRAPADGYTPSIVLSELFFPFDDAELTDEGRMIVDNVAAILKEHPEYGLDVRGYADEAGNDEYNASLSSRRAQSAADYLRARDLPAHRVRARGLGKLMERARGGPNPQKWNRRVELVLEMSP